MREGAIYTPSKAFQTTKLFTIIVFFKPIIRILTMRVGTKYLLKSIYENNDETIQQKEQGVGHVNSEEYLSSGWACLSHALKR